MARATTVADVEEETPGMFPELDEKNEKHRELMKAAKRFHKSKSDRAELLSTAKEKQDEDEARLVALCRQMDMPKFKHNGISVEIIAVREKAIVKIAADDEDESEDE